MACINWTRFTFAVLCALLDSAFTHGYHLFCFRSIARQVKAWLILHGRFKLKLNETDYNTVHLSHNTFLDNSILIYLDASFAFGAAIGSCFIGIFANIFGRKGGLLMTAFISCFASLFFGYCKYFENPYLLFIGRMLFGVKTGINSGLGPMYLFEISPQEIRGQVCMLYGVFVSMGSVAGSFARIYFANERLWPLVESITVVPAILQLILLPNCPESPKYLRVIKNNELECKRALKWFRGDGFNVEEELEKLRNEYHQRRVHGELRLRFILNNQILRYALITSTVLTSSQQICGVTMLLIHAKRYMSGHASQNMSNIFNIIKTGSIIVFFFFTEKCSRRTYYLVSFTGMSIVGLLLCFLFCFPSFPLKDFYCYTFLAIFVVFYKIGTGALSWFAASEYFNTSAAPLAYSIGVGANWFIKGCLLTYAEPLNRLLEGYSFLNYAITNLFLAYFTYSKVIDTRNKSLKEVYRDIHFTIKNNNDF